LFFRLPVILDGESSEAKDENLLFVSFLKRRGLFFGQSREDLLNPNFYHWKQKEHLFVSSSLFHFSFLVVLNEEGNTREKGVKNERRRVLRTLV
jgi:hypothetical protein